MRPTIRKSVRACQFILAALLLCRCDMKRQANSGLEDVAANEDVANYMRSFEGRGALADSTSPTPPQEALSMFRCPDDLAVDLVLSEPAIRQPVEIGFDYRGRLWVVQYNQYPYPEGLKVTSIDNHLRANFDKVPEPPPVGAKGADKITIFEDTDRDGQPDKATDAITGLNIATSVTQGRGRIWVLNPPYLLAYPDPDGDGLPDGSPVVHLSGFGLEDTHAVANSLCWGPDGWLYGAQGSTTTANITSAESKNIAFSGQAIWRYHPDSQVFEIFAEGGGNTFYVEMDDQGRIYSGDNGLDRGQYYKQGAYYIKNWGKHGGLTNAYAFGYLPNMVLTGDRVRFTHAWIKYQGSALPERYHDAMIAINPLQSYVQLTRFGVNGSTFINKDEGRILESTDHWFRPVNLKAGPDGAVYIADWYDSRLSHVDPHDTWHKSSGRIYRLRGKEMARSQGTFDLSTYANDQLIGLLSHKNKWFRQQAIRLFADRKDRSVVPQLLQILEGAKGQIALESLWAIHASGGMDDRVTATALKHTDPFVRMWGVRLAGDDFDVPNDISGLMEKMAHSELHPEVRSQLACTAKRLPGPDAIPIIRNLLRSQPDADDPDLPLLIWWATESKAISDRDALLAIFEDRSLWARPVVEEVILGRLMQRYAMEGEEALDACATLLRLAPTPGHAKALINGLQEGLRGSDLLQLPSSLADALRPYKSEFKEETLALELRQGQKAALDQALRIVADDKHDVGKRLAYIQILGEIRQPGSITVLVDVLRNNRSSGAIRQNILLALQHFDDETIGSQVVASYPDRLRSDPAVRESALSLFASRPAWAHQLVDAISKTKQISRDDVPEQVVRRLKLLNDAGIAAAVERLWPEVRLATSAEKDDRIARISKVVRSGNGNAVAGAALFKNSCGPCHRLFGNGGSIGPDLTGYERDNLNYLLVHTIDPNADIREDFVNYVVHTTDGRTLEGIISDRRGNTMTIRPPGAESMTLATDQIKDLRAQPTSLMPERLLDGLTDQELRDLFAYLMKVE